MNWGMTSAMRLSAFSLAASVVFVPCSARAQTDFSATTLAEGQVVRVTDLSGVSVQGVVTDVMPSSLRVGSYVFQPKVGLKVERLGDTLWDGAAIGFAVGAFLGGSTNRTGCFSNKGVGCVVKPGLVFGTIAALIDRAMVGRRTVFVGKAPGSAAWLIRLPGTGRGLLVSFSF